MKAKEKGWYPCPKCGNTKMIKIRPDTMLKNFPAYCKKCKTESVINVDGAEFTGKKAT